MRRLMDSISLTFTRYAEQQIVNYRVVHASEPDTVDAMGSLEPYEQDTDTAILPEGRNSTTAYLFFTDVELRYADKQLQTKADTTVVKGKTYEVFPYEDWSLNSSTLKYQTYLLIEEEEGNVP